MWRPDCLQATVDWPRDHISSETTRSAWRNPRTQSLRFAEVRACRKKSVNCVDLLSGQTDWPSTSVTSPRCQIYSQCLAVYSDSITYLALFYKWGPLDNHTWQTEWSSVPLAIVQLNCVSTKTKLWKQRFFCQLDCPVARQNFSLLATAHIVKLVARLKLFVRGWKKEQLHKTESQKIKF